LFLAFYNDVSINKEKVEFGTKYSFFDIKEKEIQLSIPGRVEKITPLVTVKFVGK
jgi:hypothetical protein